MVQGLRNDGHYLGAHSDAHLLYADWKNRDSLLVSRHQFTQDLLQNYAAMAAYGIGKADAPYFLPPYEWYNDSISAWTKALGLQLVSYSPGTLSHADYTVPGAANYRDSETIFRSIEAFERASPSGLNGFMLLLHIGTDPVRTDRFYHQLPRLLQSLQAKGYRLTTVDRLLK